MVLPISTYHNYADLLYYAVSSHRLSGLKKPIATELFIDSFAKLQPSPTHVIRALNTYVFQLKQDYPSLTQVRQGYEARLQRLQHDYADMLLGQRYTLTADTILIDSQVKREKIKLYECLLYSEVNYYYY